MKPVCVPCQRFFRPKHTGVHFIEGMPVDDAQPGTAEPEKWSPYKLWAGDRWACESCGAEIIVGVPHYPIAEHWQPDFRSKVALLGADYQVNDC